MRVRGVPMQLHPEGDFLSDHIRRTGDFYEVAILEELRARLNGGRVIDAGAMIGNHSMFMAAFCRVDAVEAFEPDPYNLPLLNVNTLPFKHVTVHPLALSDTEDVQLAFRRDPDNHGHTTAASTDPFQVSESSSYSDFDAPTVTIDGYGWTDVTLIKLDVEWHEPQVLAGARETIERCRPLIVIEDWAQAYRELLPKYWPGPSWPDHQTYLYEPA